MEDIETIKQEITNLKCSLCNLLLTVPPIFIVSSEGTTLKCGRCQDIGNSTTAVRNVPLESIAKHLTFPCSFENCGQVFAWGQSEKHEKICRNKIIRCPFDSELSPCSVEFLLQTTETHMNENHNDSVHSIVNDSVSIPLIITNGAIESKIMFLKQDNLQFMVFLHDEIIIFVSLQEIEKYTKFNIKISNSEDNAPNKKSIFYENQEIILFNDRIHCMQCYDGTCTLLLHQYNNRNFDFENATHAKINWGEISGLFSSSVVITFNLIENSRPDIFIKHVLSINSNHFDGLRRSLECIVCNQYMSSPIYNCTLGHSVCFHCNDYVNDCPSCREEMTESKNFSLQSIIENVQFPCKFWINGCIFMDTILNITRHEDSCPKNNG